MDKLRKRVFCIWLACLPLMVGAQSPSYYQIDLLVFAHQSERTTITPMPLILSQSTHAIVLQPKSNNIHNLYQLLPSNYSGLLKQAQQIRNKTSYPILLNYSWLQPINGQRPISLDVSYGTTRIKGNFFVRKSNYYLLETQLIFSSTTKSFAPFVVTQQQRLKPNTVYYLDHPQAGMLVKIHNISIK